MASGELFPLHRCRTCGWKFQTREGLRGHRERKHPWLRELRMAVKAVSQ